LTNSTGETATPPANPLLDVVQHAIGACSGGEGDQGRNHREHRGKRDAGAGVVVAVVAIIVKARGPVQRDRPLPMDAASPC
jgi:hypothetical protein